MKKKQNVVQIKINISTQCNDFKFRKYDFVQ